MNPHQYERRVLVCVTGLTPQVVTETIYALAHQPEPWIPTEVHILTTREGSSRAKLLLLAPDRNQFGKLVEEFTLGSIAFDEGHIHVLQDGSGRPMEDIRTQADNMATADGILRKMAEFSADPDCAIHVSLAGGRKSMGFFAGYALSLCGRQQDRLSHVLISPEFESLPEFFFPSREPRVLITRSNEPISTQDAVIELANIPFVRLRSSAPRELIERGNFREVVEAAQRVAEPPSVRVILKDRVIECAGEMIPFSSMEFVVYAWHASRCRTLEEPAVELALFNTINSPVRDALRRFGEDLFGAFMSRDREKWDERDWYRPEADHGQWLSECRTRINNRIRDLLGEAGLAQYGIQSTRIGGRSSAHRLDLPSDCIEWVVG